MAIATLGVALDWAVAISAGGVVDGFAATGAAGATGAAEPLWLDAAELTGEAGVGRAVLTATWALGCVVLPVEVAVDDGELIGKMVPEQETVIQHIPAANGVAKRETFNMMCPQAFIPAAGCMDYAQCWSNTQ